MMTVNINDNKANLEAIASKILKLRDIVITEALQLSEFSKDTNDEEFLKFQKGFTRDMDNLHNLYSAYNTIKFANSALEDFQG